MNCFGDGEDKQSSSGKTLTADFSSKKNSLGNSSSIAKPNFSVTHASLPDLSTCGVDCLAGQVDSVVENVFPKIPSYGLREFQQRFEDLRRENFSLKVSLSYAQLKLQELGATDVFFNGGESFDDFSTVKKKLAEKEIAYAKARKEWDREIQIRDEKIMSLREKQRIAERVYQEAEILKIKCENLQEEKEVYEGMLKELRLSYNLLLEQLKATNGSLCDDDGSESMVLMSKKEAIILDLKTTIAHLEAELDEKCNKLKQYANIDMETLENCIECKKIKGELELLEKKHNFEMEELEKQLRHAEKNAAMWKETLADLKLASDEKLPTLVTSSESNESHAVSSEEEIDRLKMEVEKERQKRIKREKVIIHIREKYFNGGSKSWNSDWQLLSKHSELLDSNFANTTMQNSTALPEIEPEFQSKLRQVYDRTKHLYSRLKSSAAALNGVRMKLAKANGNELSNIAGLSALNEDILENMNATAAFISLLEGNSFSHSVINGGDGGGGTDNMFLHIVEVEEEVKQLRQHLDSRDKHIEELDGLLKSRQKIIDNLKLELDAFLLKKESSLDKAVETEAVIQVSEDKGVLCKLSFDPISFDWPNLVTKRCDWLPNFSCNFIQMLDLFAQITQRNDISDSKRDEYVGNLLTNMCATVLPLISQKNATHSTNGVEQEDDDEEENESCPINVADLSVKPETILIAELKTILSTVRAWYSCRDSLRTEEFEEELRKMTIALKMCISATNAICKINNNNANETTDSAKESLKVEPKKDCTTNGTAAVDGERILEVPDVGLKERNAKLEKYIKLLKGKFKQLEKYLMIGEEEVQLSKNSSLTDLDRLDRVEMLLRSSDTREKQLSATIEQLERNNERLAEYVRTIEATVDDQSFWKKRCLDFQRKYDLAKLKIETLQQAINDKEKPDKSIISNNNNNNNNNGLLQKENGKSNNDPSDNNTNNIAACSNATTAATAMDKLNTTTPTADKTMKIMDDLAELLTSSQKNISIAMNQFVKFLSESSKPKEKQVNLSKLIKDLKCSLENVRTCNVSIGACIQDTSGSLDDILIENKHLQQKVQELQQELDDVRGELCSTVKDFDDYKSLVSDVNRDIKEDLKKTGKVLQKFKKK
ncbi:hypothetical protein T4D_13123 [Trichinella pseudospiralis]|uniref:Uncharacterized protein n=1 Tax=Trichinella pseudospiralis TaxID=6337 RepID=A0A0V1FEL4_TRIPS|nr:hypothetical protein T4D_13123 [Trichinella pseudospiralis]